MDSIKNFFNQAVEYLGSFMSSIGDFFSNLFSGEEKRRQPELDLGYIMNRSTEIVKQSGNLNPNERAVLDRLEARMKRDPDVYQQIVTDMNESANQALARVKETKQIDISDARDMDPKAIAMMDLIDGKVDGRLDINKAIRNIDFNGDKKIDKSDGDHVDAKAFGNTIRGLVTQTTGGKAPSVLTSKGIDGQLNSKDLAQVEAMMDAIGTEVDFHYDGAGKLEYIDISNLPEHGPVVNLPKSMESSNHNKSSPNR